MLSGADSAQLSDTEKRNLKGISDAADEVGDVADDLLAFCRTASTNSKVPASGWPRCSASLSATAARLVRGRGRPRCYTLFCSQPAVVMTSSRESFSGCRIAGFDGMTALRLARERLPEIPVMVISGVLSEDEAANCLDWIREQQ
jgi:hypothetical protein